MTARPNVAVPILMYHSVLPTATAGFRRYTVTPARFEEHVAALRADGWTFVTFAEAAAGLRDGGPSPRPKSVALTFDDGLADFHLHVLPLLAAYGIPATLFVPTAYIGATTRWLPGEDADRPTLNWSQLQEAVSAGVEIGSHGHRHIPVDIGPPARTLDEFRRSRGMLEDGLGIDVRTLAYPFGYQTATTRRLSRSAGYTAACAVIGLPALPGDHPAALPRIAAVQEMDGPALVQTVSRRYGSIERRMSIGKQIVWEWARRTGQVGPEVPQWHSDERAPEVPA